ncbi:type VI secretion system baseplate subunit TssG [Shewanella surugensis]|uniref:Type VI secretion system baseplate subunit TssG n=1 Tax=Shewanella surugensis TaxID=212020 RepID=A0ABT0LCW3_9GAMM|nr:type VI secretion system baseplate subunit TssG [Shewanella surugensis]MCL1125546.1 type VI secretion system baseplate subunit TssG [Shewanella surugensis]
MEYTDRAAAVNLMPPEWQARMPEKVRSYNFFQLVELIHRLEGNDADSREWEQQGKLFFTADPSLGFASSDVSSLTRLDDNRLQLDTTFLGLNGSQSPLPNYLLDQIADPEDEGMKRNFLDFFNHRLISLFYKSWRKYRYYVRFQDNASDAFSAQVFSLVGLANEDLRGETSINWCKMLAYAGMLAGRSRSPQTVSGIIAHCFDLNNVSIREWEKRKVRIPESQQFLLGKDNASLGMDTMIGEQVTDVMGKFVICIDDLSFELFQDFLPSGKEFKPLCKVMEMVLREQMAFDLELTLAKEATPMLTLGDEKGGQLGWSSFLSKTQQKKKVLIQIRQ